MKEMLKMDYDKIFEMADNYVKEAAAKKKEEEKKNPEASHV